MKAVNSTGEYSCGRCCAEGNTAGVDPIAFAGLLKSTARLSGKRGPSRTGEVILQTIDTPACSVVYLVALCIATMPRAFSSTRE